MTRSSASCEVSDAKTDEDTDFSKRWLICGLYMQYQHRLSLLLKRSVFNFNRINISNNIGIKLQNMYTHR